MEDRPLSIQERTLVFTFAKGLQVNYSHFLPILAPYMGRFTAFGTVGVGHIWHITFNQVADADEFIGTYSKFVICDNLVEVSVSKYADTLNVGTIFWLPYWVPHSDVVRTIASYTENRATCTYIQIPQKEYQGCYSTKRRVESPTCLKDMPYFFNINSEGVTYRVFLFVPGREAVCFKCKKTGHMRNSCPGTEQVVPMDTQQSAQINHVVDPPVNEAPVSDLAPEVPIEVQKTLVVGEASKVPVQVPSETYDDPKVSEVARIMTKNPTANHKDVWEWVQATAKVTTKEDFQPCRKDDETSCNPTYSEQSNNKDESEYYSESNYEVEKVDHHYFISYQNAEGGSSYVSRRGQPIAINPPVENQIEDELFERLLAKCTDRRCAFLRSWEDELIGYQWMYEHLYEYHRTYQLQRDYSQLFARMKTTTLLNKAFQL